MSTIASPVTVHLAGEDKDEICLDTMRGKIWIERSEQVLTAYGRLAAWRERFAKLTAGPARWNFPPSDPAAEAGGAVLRLPLFPVAVYARPH